jgi:hypothetical protein
MTEAEFERRQQVAATATATATQNDPGEPQPSTATEAEPSGIGRGTGTSRGRASRVKPAAKPRRVQRMFALEEELDKKLWLYAIHVGKDRSEVVNDLLRPIVASMVLYDSRDRRATRPLDQAADRSTDQDGEAA